MGNTASAAAEYNPANIATEKATSLTRSNPGSLEKSDTTPLPAITTPLAQPAQATISDSLVGAQLSGFTEQISGVGTQVSSLNNNVISGFNTLGGQIGSLSTQVNTVGTQLGSQITQVRGDIASTGSFLSGQIGNATNTLSAGQSAIAGQLQASTQMTAGLLGDATRFTAGEISQLNDNLGDVQRSLSGSIDGAVNSLMWPIVIGGVVIGYILLNNQNNGEK